MNEEVPHKKRYRGIRHDVNECKATTGEGNE